MSRADEEWVLKPNAYSGTLVIGGEAHAVSFSAEVGKDHRCVVKMNPVEKETYLLLHRNFGRPGLPQEHLELTGTASNGDMLTSKEAWIRRLGANDDGFNVELSFHQITASIGLPKKQVRPVLRRWFRSFRSFRNSIQHTPLGDARVHGTEKSIDKDEVSGCVAMQTTSEFESVSWRENAEAFLSHMHTGLSFMHGGRLQSPRVDYIADEKWEATFYSGSGFAPEIALQYFLFHDPFIKALVDVYFKNGPLNEGFLTALGWLQMPTTFDEIRFISAMTALEVIVDTQLSDAEKGGMLPKADFRALRKRLDQAIDDASDAAPESKVIFKAKIADANKKVLSQKIDALFERLSVPTRDFDKDKVKHLTVVRNAIVHRGVVPNGEDIWDDIILIRELINRILMGAIGFEGRYCCYIGGEHERTFPDLKDFPPKDG